MDTILKKEQDKIFILKKFNCIDEKLKLIILSKRNFNLKTSLIYIY